MPHRIEVVLTRGHRDAIGSRVAMDIKNYLGFNVDKVRTIDVYTIDADLSTDAVSRLGNALADPVIQEWSADKPLAKKFDWLVEVGFKPGVTDNVGRTATESARLVLGDEFPDESAVYTSRQYLISGEFVRSEVETITTGLLGNPLINRYKIFDFRNFDTTNGVPLEVPKVTDTSEPKAETINLEISDSDLINLSRDMTWALSLDEMQVIRDHYRRPEIQEDRRAHNLPESPTDVEMEVLAQTWSEHCKHKIFSAIINYNENGDHQEINSLFKTYVQGVTRDVRARLGKNDYCRSVFVDNAGVWKFDDENNLVFKVETHNSPSALDPYGGALTGIVGVNRDPHGTGQGSRLFCNTNVFCLADPFHEGEIPLRLLHPRRVLEGVREGVEHGGNKSGIPTVNGSLVFDERFLGKPLVFCGTGGIMPSEINGKPGHEKGAKAGDHVIMIGGRIGKDGIHGATFSSEELHEGSPATAVQIGDPITQKRMIDFLLRARDEGLMSCLTDNGAGGLSSSIGETAELPGGAKIDLQKAPVKYQGLQPWEIFVSEAQERMTAAVPTDKIERFMTLSNEMGVESTDLGQYTSGPYLELFYGDKPVGLFLMDFLHNGLPQMQLKATWKTTDETDPAIPDSGDLGDKLTKMLGQLDICSKEYWVRQYDHEVQGGSVVKPLCGAMNDGPSDASVMRPVLESMRAVAVSHGICPNYSDIDSYHMAACAVDEAMRGIVCVGGDPDMVAALDNFCWCDPVQSKSNPDGQYKLAQLVRANRALYDVCVTYGMPLVSGKDSMKNDYSIGDTKISIPPTLLVTAVGQLGNAQQAVTMDAKRAGDVVYLLGETHADVGASHYFEMLNLKGGSVPKLRDPDATIKSYRWLHRAIKSGLVASCHDLSDGGLGVAAAETSFAGSLGMVIDLRDVSAYAITRNDVLLFSETPGRILLTIRSSAVRAFEIIMGEAVKKLGYVSDDKRLVVTGLDGDTVIDADIFQLKQAWKQPLSFEEVR